MNFDPIAPFFRPLEYLVFQGSMQAARRQFAERAAGVKNALVAGEGDGRTLEALLQANPSLEVEVVDSSARMIARARSRLAGKGFDLQRVTWRHEELRDCRWPEGRFEMVVTPFFLDCFDESGLSIVIPTLGRALGAEGVWLQMDFSSPNGPLWHRWRSRFWLGVMHLFFRWTTGLEAESLVDPSPRLEEVGLRRIQRQAFRGGLIHAEVWQRFT